MKKFGKHYLKVVDYYSKYFEINKLTDTTSATVVHHTKKIFARYGIPKLVFSENGPEFTSVEFKRFSAKWDFKLETSRPEYAQCNGLVERESSSNSEEDSTQVLKKAAMINMHYLIYALHLGKTIQLHL